jgi:uroporphyrinogen decarboxylase
MVCSGINEPARSQFDRYLREHRDVDLTHFLRDTVDIAEVEPDYIGPTLAEDTDYWGVGRATIRQAAGGEYNEIVHYPLQQAESVTDLERYPWPRTDWFDYSVLPEKIAQLQSERERAIMTLNGNIFESSWYMRGLDTMMMDFVLRPDVAHAIAERVTSFFLDYFDRVLTAAEGAIDLVFTADDLGGQNGLLLSRAMWEEFIKPYHVRLNALIHSHGARVIYHTDGAVSEVVDGLVDMGIDVLQALQFDAAGMDAHDLKERFGSVLCFEGGVSVQRTLPDGAPEQVRAEVAHLVATLGRGGGYILGPSHWIQAGTPVENIMAMFDTALG